MYSCAEEDLSYSDFPKIDAHVHIRYPGFELTKQAVSDNFKLITIIHDRYNIDWQMSFIEKQIAYYPDQVNYITTFTIKGWDNTDWQKKTIDHLKKEFDKGAIAVKIWKNIGMEFKDKDGRVVYIDNPRFDPIFDIIKSKNKTLTGHIADPIDSWYPINEMKVQSSREYYTNNPEYHMYHHPGYPQHDQLIQSYINMLEKHPNLRYVGCHLGSLASDLNQLTDLLNRFPNMAVDLSGRIDDIQMLPVEEVRQFFLKFQDRIIYGTDLSIRESHNPKEYKKFAHQTWKRDWTYFTTDSTIIIRGTDTSVQGLKLPQSIINKIYWDNTKNWYPDL
jgi:hypothetical protein